MQAPAISSTNNYAQSTRHWLHQTPPSLQWSILSHGIMPSFKALPPGHTHAVEPGQQYPVDLSPRLNFDKEGVL